MERLTLDQAVIRAQSDLSFSKSTSSNAATLVLPETIEALLTGVADIQIENTRLTAANKALVEALESVLPYAKRSENVLRAIASSGLTKCRGAIMKAEALLAAQTTQDKGTM